MWLLSDDGILDLGIHYTTYCLNNIDRLRLNDGESNFSRAWNSVAQHPYDTDAIDIIERQQMREGEANSFSQFTSIRFLWILNV